MSLQAGLGTHFCLSCLWPKKYALGKRCRLCGAIFRRTRRPVTDETRHRLSVVKKEHWTKPEYRNVKIKNAIERWARPGERERASEKQKECWGRPGSREGRSGPNHGLWKDGSAMVQHPPEFNIELRGVIRKRDDHLCQNPKCYCPENGHVHSVHHINFKKSDHSGANLITLCMSCHSQTTSGDRDYWQEYYQNVQELRGLL